MTSKNVLNIWKNYETERICIRSKNATFGKEQSRLVNKSNSKIGFFYIDGKMRSQKADKTLSLISILIAKNVFVCVLVFLFHFSFYTKLYMFHVSAVRPYANDHLLYKTVAVFISWETKRHSTGQLSFSSLTMFTISFIAYQCLMSTFYWTIIYFNFIIVYYQWTANKHQMLQMVWPLDLSVWWIILILIIFGGEDILTDRSKSQDCHFGKE